MLDAAIDSRSAHGSYEFSGRREHMKLKKVLACLLVIPMVASMLAGCGKGSSGTKAGKSETTKVKDKNSTGSSGEFKKKLDVTWWGVANSADGTKEDTYGELLIEKLLNINIEPTFYDGEGYKSVRPVEMAGGNVPDFMLLTDPRDVQQAAEQGFLMEVPFDMIEKYAPTYMKMINDAAPSTWLYSNYDNKNYGVVNLNPTGDHATLSLWRKDWLNKVGISKVPETLDEMEEAFDGFVNKDPDGNGKKDTYALSGDVKDWWSTFSDTFGAYGLLPFSWVDDGKGQVTYGGLDKKVKDVLARLASWYKKGYIHPDMITDEFGTTIRDKFSNGQIGFMNLGEAADLNEGNPSSVISLARQIDPEAEVELGLPVKGPDGKQGTFSWGTSGQIMAFGSQLKDNPEKAIRILKLLEMECKDEDLAIKLHIGEEGKQWKRLSDEEAKQSDLNIEFIGDLKEPAQYHAAGFNIPVSSRSTWGMYAMPVDQAKQFWTDFNKKIDQEYVEKARKITMNDMFGKPDVLPSAGKYFNDLVSKQLVAFAKIITGEEPVDSYDKFVKEWKKEGGDTLLKEAQDMKNLSDRVQKKALAETNK